MAEQAVIAVKDLVKRYGEVEAVRGIDLEVRPGEIFGFLGPNGAGKSTTINILCTLVQATSGSASVAGFDVDRQADAVRRHIGLVFQDPSLDQQLSARENLEFHAFIYDVPAAIRKQRIDEVLEMVELTDRAGSMVMTFSGGMRRRLEIARGMLHTPEVLFLDEPTIGLDPQTRRHIWGYLAELPKQKGVTIFMTTHYMDEAEYCDRIAIIDHGSVIALGTPEVLKASVGTDRVRIRTDDDEFAIGFLREHLGLEPTFSEGAVTFAVASGEHFVPRLFAELPVAIRSVSVARPSLDDVFMSYTGTSIRDAESGQTASLRRSAAIFGRTR
jgi:ABC-2 type transport system ATP-binding protein